MGEAAGRREKAVVLANFELRAQVCAFERGANAPFAGLGDDHAGRAMARCRAAQFADKTADVLGRVEVDVVDGQALRAQRLGEMPHT